MKTLPELVIPAKSAVIVVDVQNCFIAGGTLAVRDGAAVMPVINRIAPDIGLGPIIRGTLPFVVLMAVGVVILSVAPGIALWLPDAVFNK